MNEDEKEKRKKEEYINLLGLLFQFHRYLNQIYL